MTCATVRVSCAWSAGTEMSKRSSSADDRLHDLQRVEAEIGDEIALERRLDRPTADVLQNLDDGVVNDGGSWAASYVIENIIE